MATVYDAVVVGGGPGGYVAAVRAAQLGLKTAIIEKERLGGVCLNWGCIPTKSLLRNAAVLNLFKDAREWGISAENVQADYGKAYDRSRRVVDRLVKGVEFLIKGNKIDLFSGTGVLEDRTHVRVNPSGETLETRSVILATGGRARKIPAFEVDGSRIITSYHAVQLKSPPPSIMVVGAGAIGCEFAYLFKSYGSQVFLVEMMDRVLPLEDAEISAVVQKAFTKQGIKIITGARVEKLDQTGEKINAEVSTQKGAEQIAADVVLVAIGVQGNVEEIGLEKLGVQVERSFIKVDDQMRTNVEGIYAIGDVTGPPGLAHVASAQGVVAIETIANRPTHPLRYPNMPRATYCEPQVGSLGLTEQQARDAGRDVRVGRFPFRVSGKALALNEHEGLVKVVTDSGTGEILGVHMVGPEVTELLGEYEVAITAELTIADVARAVHPHPTLSEGLMEAALNAMGEAIHVPNS